MLCTPRVATTIVFIQVYPDNFMKREILSLKIKCPGDGCNWSGEIRNLEVGLKATQCGTIQYYTIHYSTAQHSTAQHSTAQHSTAQHSAVQCSAVK